MKNQPIKEDLINAFLKADYEKCFTIAQKMMDSLIIEDRDFFLLICSISSMFEGSTNEDHKLIWLKNAVEERILEQKNINGNLLLLKSFEATKLIFEGSADKALSIIEDSLNKCSSPETEAMVRYFSGMYYLNTSEDSNDALQVFLLVDSALIDCRHERMDHYFYNWNKSMISFCYNKLERFEEAISTADEVLFKAEKHELFPLYENAYLSLFESYAGLKQEEKAFQYIDQNIRLWKKLRIPKRVAVAAFWGCMISSGFENKSRMIKYASIRKEYWIRWESHWNMIQEGFQKLEMFEEAAQWEFD